MSRFFFVLTAIVLASSGAAGAQSPSAPSNGLMNPGDQIRILVWRNPNMSGDFQIAADGTVVHPLYREVQVTGVPLSVVEERLRTFLSRYETNPQFVIQPLVKIVVGGEVRNPNVFSVPPETTVGQSLALAGGPTERADLRSIRLLRDRQVLSIDLSGPDAQAPALQIRSGDQLIVGRGRPPVSTYIGPIASTVAAVAAIVSIVLR